MRLVTFFGRGAKAVTLPVVIALIAMGGGFALANHDPNTFHACASNSSGALRKVTSPADCRSSEHAVEWNVQGPVGERGPAGFSEHEVVSNTSEVFPGLESHALAYCPVGKVVTGGGYETDFDSGLRIAGSFPKIFEDVDTWVVHVRNESTPVAVARPQPVTVYAICVNAG